jgi:hypothetical protein
MLTNTAQNLSIEPEVIHSSNYHSCHGDYRLVELVLIQSLILRAPLLQPSLRVLKASLYFADSGVNVES